MDGEAGQAATGKQRLGFERIEAMLWSVPAAPGEKAGRWERGSFLAGLAAAALAVSIGLLVP